MERWHWCSICRDYCQLSWPIQISRFEHLIVVSNGAQVMIKETIARKLPTTILTTIATLIFTGWVVWLLVKFVLEFRLRDLIGVAIVIAVVSLLAVFMVYSKRAARVIESGFKAYFLFLGWALAALVPVSLFYWLSPLIISSS